MEEILLNAARRETVGKRVKHLRREGAIPGILYGHHVESLSLQVEQRALEEALQEAGANRLITLTVEGLEEPRKVLVRDLQRDSISHAMLHVDFYEVIMTEKLTAEIPITFVGVPPSSRVARACSSRASIPLRSSVCLATFLWRLSWTSLSWRPSMMLSSCGTLRLETPWRS